MSSGPRVRRSSEEIRRLLLDAGVEILLDEGLGSGAEGLTFKRVYGRLERTRGVRLTNASVIGRAFRTQEEFQTEVLATIAASDSQDFRRLAEVIVEEVLVEADLTSLEGRWRCIRDISRTTGVLLLDILRSSPVWRVWIGIWALAGSGEQSPEKDRLAGALLMSYRSVMRDTTSLSTAILAMLGFRVKAPMTMEHGASAIQALAEGSALRDLVDEGAMRHISMPTGPAGEPEEWTVFGIALHTLITQFIEPDPGWQGAATAP